jgi:hypothetical protein
MRERRARPTEHCENSAGRFSKLRDPRAVFGIEVDHNPARDNILQEIVFSVLVLARRI